MAARADADRLIAAVKANGHAGREPGPLMVTAMDLPRTLPARIPPRPLASSCHWPDTRVPSSRMLLLKSKL
jgi:hypothetical protein